MRSRACPSFKVFSSPARLPQVLFINTILKLLWPHLSPAIHKMAMEQAKVPLEDVCKKVRLSGVGAGHGAATGLCTHFNLLLLLPALLFMPKIAAAAPVCFKLKQPAS